MKLNGIHELYYKKNKGILIDFCKDVEKENNIIAISEVWTKRFR
jgi:hypothetical protein